MKKLIILNVALTLILLAVLGITRARRQPDGAPRGVVEKTAQLPVRVVQVAPAPPAASEQEDPAGAVFDGFHIEMTAWYVCVAEAKVYSNPQEHENFYLSTLPEGTPVIMRELDLGTRTFAAIEVAEYTKLTNLCPAED